MAAKIGREYMPTHAQRRNDRKKDLPAPPKSMQKNERRPMGRAFGVVQTNLASIEVVFNETGMIFTHNIFALNIFGHKVSVARGTGVVSQFPANPSLEDFDIADLDGIDVENVATQQHHVRQLSRRD